MYIKTRCEIYPMIFSEYVGYICIYIRQNNSRINNPDYLLCYI